MPSTTMLPIEMYQPNPLPEKNKPTKPATTPDYHGKGGSAPVLVPQHLLAIYLPTPEAPADTAAFLCTTPAAGGLRDLSGLDSVCN